MAALFPQAGDAGVAVKFIITRQGQGDKSSMPKKMRALSVPEIPPLCLHEHSYLFSSISIKNKVQQQQQQQQQKEKRTTKRQYSGMSAIIWYGQKQVNF